MMLIQPISGHINFSHVVKMVAVQFLYTEAY